jgi:hypothetical protein
MVFPPLGRVEIMSSRVGRSRPNKIVLYAFLEAYFSIKKENRIKVAC